MDDLTASTKEMLEAAIAARMPTMIVGAPGTGKTATVKQIAKDRGYHLITLVGSRMDPTDVTGLPKGENLGKLSDAPDAEDTYGTVNLAPVWQVDILKKKKVILFLDEWGNSPGAVQAAFLTLLQDREFANGDKFPAETIVIGAMNPPEEGADSYEMALPTMNRIFWISWSPTAESWYNGMLAAWGKTVSDEEMSWRKKIVRFMRDNPSWLHKQPEDAIGTPEAQGVSSQNASEMAVLRYAWPSRRSWDNLSRVLTEAPDNNYIQDTISKGIVGAGASNAFREWLIKNDVISPEEVIADPSSVDWTTVSQNDAHLILRAVIDLINDENSMNVIELFGHIADQDRANLAVPFLRDMLKNVTGGKVSREITKQNSEPAREVLKKYNHLVQNSK